MHISQLADRFVTDPRQIVKTGDVVKVKVLEVDVQRQRIALSMKSDAAPTAAPDSRPQNRPASTGKKPPSPPRQDAPQPAGAMAGALSRALRNAR